MGRQDYEIEDEKYSHLTVGFASKQNSYFAQLFTREEPDNPEFSAGKSFKEITSVDRLNQILGQASGFTLPDEITTKLEEDRQHEIERTQKQYVAFLQSINANQSLSGQYSVKQGFNQGYSLVIMGLDNKNGTFYLQAFEKGSNSLGVWLGKKENEFTDLKSFQGAIDKTDLNFQLPEVAKRVLEQDKMNHDAHRSRMENQEKERSEELSTLLDQGGIKRGWS